MAKHTEEINKRFREIIRMENETLNYISEDLDELMDGDDIVFEEPIKTKWHDIHGITYMLVTDKSTDDEIDIPAFYVGEEHHMMLVKDVPYSVALMAYRTVLKMKKQS